MTTFDSIEPTQGDVGNSFEWIWDVATSLTTPSWLNVPDITGLQPQPSPKFKDGTTYANKGQTSQSKTGDDFTIQVQVKGVRDNTGEFQPELVALINAADSTGADNLIAYRYYHATSPTLAYQGTAAVQWTRANTGNDDLEFFSFTLTGQGDRVKITNPGLASGAKTNWTLTIGGAPTGGSFTVAINGFSTSPLAYNAANTAIAAALNALSGVTGISGFTASGSSPFTITAPSPVLLTASGSGLTGGTAPTATIA